MQWRTAFDLIELWILKEWLEKAERWEKADSILAISLFAEQYLISGDVLNPESWIWRVNLKSDKVWQRSDASQNVPKSKGHLPKTIQYKYKTLNILILAF